MIISGFAGIGKSTLAKKSYEVIDLESSIFKKDWELYSETAKYLDEQGYDVLILHTKKLEPNYMIKELNILLLFHQILRSQKANI